MNLTQGFGPGSPGWSHVREYPDEPLHPYYSKENCDEGIARYKVSAILADGLDVLDIACGSGYGAEILSEKARAVHAVDKDPEAIAYCVQHYPKTRVAYWVMDGRDLDFPDASFDYCVQHGQVQYDEPEGQHKAMAEIARVLWPSGIALVSANYNTYYGPDRTGSNPFHKWCFDVHGLYDLVTQHLRYGRVFIQHRTSFTESTAGPGTTMLCLASLTRQGFEEAWSKLLPYLRGAIHWSSR